VIGVLVSIVTWGRVAGALAATSPPASAVCHTLLASGFSPRDGCLTHRAAYLRKRTLAHHSGIALSVLKGYTMH